MIWSEDAPALENALHREFHYRRVNLINERKEFFHVEIDEGAEVVRKDLLRLPHSRGDEGRRGRTAGVVGCGSRPGSRRSR
ncbi:GIY-YIG nuclease family protein [Sorangium sp. So ce1078]|uniref:GIY-YIG nuclease family protein n=1 Tax=Sorangium sp. So ce1078 TaxID=3133329 RepID=UPI003F6484A4